MVFENKLVKDHPLLFGDLQGQRAIATVESGAKGVRGGTSGVDVANGR
jgi:hypothetical protein